jgi:hypothetical protein
MPNEFNMPMGASDRDPYFDLPSGQSKQPKREPPKTTMVYCPPCGLHWKAPAHEKYWQPRVELCPDHSRQAADSNEDEQ